MSTNSIIAMQVKNGSIKTIYCHWDGYFSWNGEVLLTHYTDPKKVSGLLRLGNLSSLGHEIGKKHDFEQYDEKVCTAYRRDRGEKGQGAITYKDEKSFLDDEGGNFGEYVYLFRDGKWFYLKDCKEFTELTKEKCKERC